MMELLTGALSGGLFSHETFQADPSGLTQFLQVIPALDVSAFVDQAQFASAARFIILSANAEPG